LGEREGSGDPFGLNPQKPKRGGPKGQNFVSVSKGSVFSPYQGTPWEPSRPQQGKPAGGGGGGGGAGGPPWPDFGGLPGPTGGDGCKSCGKGTSRGLSNYPDSHPPERDIFYFYPGFEGPCGQPRLRRFRTLGRRGAQLPQVAPQRVGPGGWGGGPGGGGLSIPKKKGGGPGRAFPGGNSGGGLCFAWDQFHRDFFFGHFQGGDSGGGGGGW